MLLVRSEKAPRELSRVRDARETTRESRSKVVESSRLAADMTAFLGLRCRLEFRRRDITCQPQGQQLPAAHNASVAQAPAQYHISGSPM